MFTTLFSATLFVVFAVQGVLADFTIDTPNFVQCAQAQITWTASTAPYNLIIVSADDVCGNALVNLGDQTGLSTTYTVALASGTQVVLSLEDAEGDEAWSGTITVAGSSDSSCLTSSNTTSATTLSLPNTVAASSATPTTFSPAGAANAGLNPSTGGALSIRPLGALASVGSGLLALAFIL